MVIHKIDSNHEIFRTSREKINENKKEKKNDSVKSEKTQNNNNVSLTNKARLLQKTESILRNALDSLHDFDNLRNDKLADVKSHIEDNFINSEFVRNKTADRILDENPDFINQIRESEAFKKNMVTLKYGFSDNEVSNNDKIVQIKERLKNNFYSNESVKKETIEKLLDNLDF
jgi:hypothetical protein